MEFNDFKKNADKRYYGEIDLSQKQNVPDSEDGIIRLKGSGKATIELFSSNLDGDKTVTLKTGVNLDNKTSWNTAKSNGSEITETLTNDTALTITFEGNPNDYFYLSIASGTGDVEYSINVS